MSERWPALLTASDAAEYLSVSDSTLTRLRGGEKIKSVLIRGSVRYRKVDLDLLLHMRYYVQVLIVLQCLMVLLKVQDLVTVQV